MIKDKKILMVVGASTALSHKRVNPNSELDQTIKHVLRNLDTSHELKIFGVAGASFVLKYIEKNPKASEKEAMQQLSKETNSILSSIELQEK